MFDMDFVMNSKDFLDFGYNISKNKQLCYTHESHIVTGTIESIERDKFFFGNSNRVVLYINFYQLAISNEVYDPRWPFSTFQLVNKIISLNY